MFYRYNTPHAHYTLTNVAQSDSVLTCAASPSSSVSSSTDVKYAAVYGGSEEIMADLTIKQALKNYPTNARL